MPRALITTLFKERAPLAPRVPRINNQCAINVKFCIPRSVQAKTVFAVLFRGEGSRHTDRKGV